MRHRLFSYVGCYRHSVKIGFVVIRVPKPSPGGRIRGLGRAQWALDTKPGLIIRASYHSSRKCGAALAERAA